MSRYELTKLMRKTLIEKHFDEEVLQPLPEKQQYEKYEHEQEQENDDLLTVKLIAD